ncbi:MAG: tetratricopeptide repeat protein [Candidatus Nitrosocosmicus sp.]|nr:tetratricopeptide repeat protein [Candidatus Nitrosocosmicus sp.]
MLYNNKGLSLYYLGDNQEAIACYDKAIEINPQVCRCLQQQRLVFILHWCQDAIACYDKAIEINPKYDLAFCNKGLVLAVTGNNQEAIACYDKAIEINPQYASAYK